MLWFWPRVIRTVLAQQSLLVFQNYSVNAHTYLTIYVELV